MARQIIVNAGISETRVAVLDGGVLTELFVERRRHRSIVGNVYKGVVTNVLPGMQAAFVDIGLAKDAFLYAGDFIANLGEYERMMLAEDEADDIELATGDALPRDETGEGPEAPPERDRRVITPIEDVLHKGQGSSSRSPRNRSAPRAPASPLSSACRAATSSTCPR